MLLTSIGLKMYSNKKISVLIDLLFHAQVNFFGTLTISRMILI